MPWMGRLMTLLFADEVGRVRFGFDLDIMVGEYRRLGGLVVVGGGVGGRGCVGVRLFGLERGGLGDEGVWGLF